MCVCLGGQGALKIRGRDKKNRTDVLFCCDIIKIIVLLLIIIIVCLFACLIFCFAVSYTNNICEYMPCSAIK